MKIRYRLRTGQVTYGREYWKNLFICTPWNGRRYAKRGADHGNTTWSGNPDIACSYLQLLESASSVSIIGGS